MKQTISDPTRETAFWRYFRRCLPMFIMLARAMGPPDGAEDGDPELL